MPIYEFHCKSCKQEFEKLVPAGASASVPECPACGGREVNRLLSVFASKSSGAGGGMMRGGPSGGCCGGGCGCH